VRFWPLRPAVEQQRNEGSAGSARHPTIAPGGARPTGHAISTRAVPTVLMLQTPDPMSVQLAGSMAIATAPQSPMSSNGGNFYSGDEGYAVNRFAGKLIEPMQQFGGNIQPITYPGSVRVGMQAGPSSAPAFPSTGADAQFSALASMNGAVLGWTL
jgi:hypothetical protein